MYLLPKNVRQRYLSQFIALAMSFLLALTKVLWQVIKSVWQIQICMNFHTPKSDLLLCIRACLSLFFLAFLGSSERNTMSFKYFITWRMSKKLLTRLRNTFYSLLYVTWSLWLWTPFSYPEETLQCYEARLQYHLPMIVTMRVFQILSDTKSTFTWSLKSLSWS